MVPRSRLYLGRTALKLHLSLVLGGGGCIAAGVFELHRALGGRELAWVYAFEWPFFAVVGGWIWWRLLHAEDAAAATQSPAPTLPSADQRGETSEDQELQAWQAYLRRLHAVDPPGGPTR
ncbi:MAG: hypothetical protein QOK10_2714 [Pseudonocardiales bacterium]|jgi:hypothetical protein|nr:hypothetical protein [Pseudonocardiales bacterium]